MKVPDQEKIASKAERQDPRPPGPLTLVPRAGSLLLSAAILAFGIEHFVVAGAVGSVMYPWVLGPRAWNLLFGALLIVLSVSIGIRKRVPLAATVLGTVLCAYGSILYLPRMIAHLHDPGPWTNVFGLGNPLSAASELLAMGGAAWVLADTGRGRLARLGRVLFAATMVVFGLQHFLYTGILATLIPAWIPWHVFWEDFVGAAFISAAAAIAANRAARPAALLLGTMFALFVLVLHVPRVLAAVGSLDEWTSALVAVAMSGGAFVMSGASERPGVRSDP